MKLSRTLVVLDLETTGTWIEKDKIIEIAMIKCQPSGETVTFDQRVVISAVPKATAKHLVVLS